MAVYVTWNSGRESKLFKTKAEYLKWINDSRELQLVCVPWPSFPETLTSGVSVQAIDERSMEGPCFCPQCGCWAPPPPKKDA